MQGPSQEVSAASRNGRTVLLISVAVQGKSYTSAETIAHRIMNSPASGSETHSSRRSPCVDRVQPCSPASSCCRTLLCTVTKLHQVHEPL